jgi:crotonobetainyl-CoA:carnitine CoA-transferase CaiB-like acyl-CoA transferase
VQKLPLEGMRVADFCAIWHGAHITQWLAVMGAEVIKVESNAYPDSTRLTVMPDREVTLETSVEFAGLNYGKKSVRLSMNKPKAQELARKLVRISDVVTDNFGGPIMERWGLGYAELKKLRPDIIALSGCGFGRTGPYKERAAYASMAEALGGLSFLNGYLDGEPNSMPAYGWADLQSAQYGVFAILAALYHRAMTGEGQYIDLSMTEANASTLIEPIMDYTMNGKVQGRMGNRDKVMAPHGCYRCRGEGRWVAIAVSTEEEWTAFCHAIGNPEWTGDDRFSDELSRWENQEELDRLIEQWTIRLDHYEVMEKLQGAGVMAGVSMDMEGLADDPHLKERGFFVDMEHPEMGKLHFTGLPWKLSDTPKGNYWYPPLLGEHNEYVFGELLGMSKKEIEQLKQEEVIY